MHYRLRFLLFLLFLRFLSFFFLRLFLLFFGESEELEEDVEEEEELHEEEEDEEDEEGLRSRFFLRFFSFIKSSSRLCFSFSSFISRLCFSAESARSTWISSKFFLCFSAESARAAWISCTWIAAGTEPPAASAPSTAPAAPFLSLGFAAFFISGLGGLSLCIWPMWRLRPALESNVRLQCEHA